MRLPETVTEALVLCRRLTEELERADNAFRVLLEGHFGPTATQAARDSVVEDLKNRGLGDHQRTRAALLQEVLYGGAATAAPSLADRATVDLFLDALAAGGTTNLGAG